MGDIGRGIELIVRRDEASGEFGVQGLLLALSYLLPVIRYHSRHRAD